MVKQGVPISRTKNDDPDTDVTTGYFYILRKKDGFSVDSKGVIKNNSLPEVTIEQLAPATESGNVIKVIV